MKTITKYPMKLVVITPIHIGGPSHRSTITKKDYIYRRTENKLIVVDSAKLINVLGKKNLLEEYIRFIADSTSNRKNIQNRVADLDGFFKTYRVENEVNNVAKFVFTNFVPDTKNGKLNDIHLHLADAHGVPYIPGSSIKGALLNALMVDYIVRNRSQFEAVRQELLRGAKGKDAFDTRVQWKKYGSNKITKMILGENINKGYGLSVSDTYEIKSLKTAILQDIDQMSAGDGDGDGKMLPIQREYILPQTELHLDITLDQKLLNTTKLRVKDACELIDCVKRATQYLTNLLPHTDIEEDLILGANTGFYQKTLVPALFPDDKDRNLVTRALLHRNDRRKMLNHKNDKISPRVINRVEIEGRLELAGLAQLILTGDKNASKA